jgi:hypothetical protein
MHICAFFPQPSWDLSPSKFDNVELAISKLNDVKQCLPTNRQYNCSLVQCNTISELCNRKDLVIYPTNKNLGPSVTECSNCIHDILETHLLNNNNYEFLTINIARLELKKQCSTFLKIYSTMEHTLPSEAKQTCFKYTLSKSWLSQTHMPQVYGIFEVHKQDIKP